MHYTQSPEWSAHVAGIIAEPADDLRRLVLCDWLEELEDDEAKTRAFLIRWQCHQGQAFARQGGGWWDRGRRTLGPVPNDVYDGLPATVPEKRPDIVVVERGFISEVHCTLADWCGGECVDCLRELTVPGTPPRLSCPACNRTGTITGVGPQIVKRHPVTRVVLTDRDPVDDPDSGFWWVIDTPDSRDAPIAAENLLPAELFNWLMGFQVNTSHTRGYADREEALSALSAAAILWANSQNVTPKDYQDHIDSLHREIFRGLGLPAGQIREMLGLPEPTAAD